MRREDDEEIRAFSDLGNDTIPPVVAAMQPTGCVVPDGILTQIGAQIGNQTQAEGVILMAVTHKEQA